MVLFGPPAFEDLFRDRTYLLGSFPSRGLNLSAKASKLGEVAEVLMMAMTIPCRYCHNRTLPRNGPAKTGIWTG